MKNSYTVTNRFTLALIILSFLLALIPKHMLAQDFKKQTKWGGRLMIDATHYDYNDAQVTGLEVRRARFFSKGSVAPRISYKLQLDFAGGKVAFKDAYIRCGNLPYIGGNMTIGNQTDPLSLEQNTSSKYITLMERSLPTSLFHKRAAGIGYSNTKLLHGRLGIQASWLDPLGGSLKAPNLKGYTKSATIKISAMPWLKSNDNLVYMGVGYSTRTLDNNLAFKVHPESHLAPTAISGAVPQVSSYRLLNFDFAWVFHALSIQGEYMTNAYQQDAGQSATAASFYGTISYFITGEHRHFKNAASGFSRIHPKHNFDPANGQWGAWEVALRYASMDLSGLFDLNPIRDITLGVNAYLNPYTRVMYNFIRSNYGTADKMANIHQVRFQIDF